MTEFNSFLKANISLTNATTGITTSNKITTGSLEGAAISDAGYVGADVTISWPTSTLGNGLATDFVLAVVYDKLNDVAFVVDAGDERSDGSVAVTVGTGRDPDEMIAFLAFYRGTAPDYLIATSTAWIVT